MCADVVATALLLYTTRLVHTLTYAQTYAIASVVYTGVVCPFRCTGGISCDGGGSGEGQIVYLLTSLTCWCSLVNVLRVKHLLFFSSVRLSYALLSLPLLYSLAVALSSCILLRLLSIVTG